MKKVFITILFLSFFPGFIFAKSGCCSNHGGVVGCTNGYDLCLDGTISSCTCGSKNDGSSAGKNQDDSSYYRNRYYQQRENNSKLTPPNNIDLSIPIAVGVGGLLIAGFIYSKKEENEKKEEYRRKYNPTEKEDLEDYEKFKNDTKIINNNKKSVIINVKILSYKTKIQCWTEYYITTDLHIRNIGKTKISYELYKSSIFNHSREIYATTKNIYISDPDKKIRDFFDFKADNITTLNIRRSKKVIESPTGIIIKLLFKTYYSNSEIEMILDLYDLKKLSNICGSIVIKENDLKNNN